jgi:hypothetical protein
MRKSSQPLNDTSAGHQVTGPALAQCEHQLSKAELDEVAAGGGKAGASTNPVED